MSSGEKSIGKNLFMNAADNQKLPTKFRVTKSMTDLTPVSLGQTKSSWAQGFIASFNEETSNYLQNYFSAKSNNYEQVCSWLK